MEFKVPVNSPLLVGNELKYLAECIETGWISSEGSFVRKFEEHFAARVGRRHGIAVCNGSVALDVAVKALKIGKWDEIILPSFTIISCAAAIVRAGATPVVVDCDPQTWNMDVTQIEAKITPRTKAIMAVHIYGLPTDMNPLLEMATRYGLRVIEDAAEAHGLNYLDKYCGSFGDISTFSFYPNKLVTTGEGGMVLTDDDSLAERCRSLRNLCFQEERRFVHKELGWNFRMSNIQAAIGVAQLERLDEFVIRKRRMGKIYSELLHDIPGIQLPVSHTDYSENIYWVYGITLNDAIPLNAQHAMRRFAEEGVGTRPFFWPMHEQPVFKAMGLFKDVSCPVAERIARRGFYIPSGVGLTDEQMQRVADVAKEILAAEN